MTTELRQHRIVGFSATAEYLGVAQNTVKKLEREDPTFPKRYQLTPRRAGFRLSDLDQWLERRAAV